MFYRTDDYIFFLTLLSVLARRYGIGIEALCIMFNHVHIFARAADIKVFKAFCRDLQSMFSTGYNNEYHMKGKLMMRSGYAPKSSRKSVLSCLIYIVNNPVAGHLTKAALEYKWNLLAYFQSDHPFSDRLVKSSCRLRMREAARMVDYCHRQGKQLNYTMLKNIFKDILVEYKLDPEDLILEITESGDVKIEEKRIPFDKAAYISAVRQTGQYREAGVWTRVIMRELAAAQEHVFFFLSFAEQYANEIQDSRRPFSLVTWEKAFEIWDRQQGEICF